MDKGTHLPVLLHETVAAIGCRPGGAWVDGTAGAGGHCEAILRATAPDGFLLACDRDPDAVAAARRRLASFGARVDLRQADFRSLPALLDEAGLVPIDGALLDLGISSMQLDDPDRGFSFQREGPLDMRMDPTAGRPAADLVNGLGERDLAGLLARHGEEPAARRIARAIVRARERRPLTTTLELAAIVEQAAGRPGLRRAHPATRTFQALRIAVNNELDGLDRLLEGLAHRLRPGGRLAVIAFHSLEDRIVKQTFRDLGRRCVCPRDMPACGCGRPDLVRDVIRRAVRPGPSELRDNPRSRSARLRAVERLAPAGGRP